VQQEQVRDKVIELRLQFVHEGRCLLGGGIGALRMWRIDTKECILTVPLGENKSGSHIPDYAHYTPEDHPHTTRPIGSIAVSAPDCARVTLRLNCY